ncbi:hypothetical protein B484DRAFT_445264 [Ochromonadaceae sp. CCMP2298]|nr:hypothetical protein B484DRAFT_445264 [Ochromonadaceae sp. CCMP2298]
MGSPMRGLQRAARRVLAAALTPTTPATHTDIHTAQSRQLGVDIGAGGVGVGREWLDSEVLLGGTEASGYLRLFVADAPPSTSTTPTPSNSTTPTLLGAVAFGESSLPSRFKALQSAGASKAAAIEGLRRNWGRSTGTGGTGGAGAGGNVTRDKGDKGDTDAYSNATMALLESFLQSRSPADCPFSGALSLLSTNAYSTASESASVSASASTSTPSSNSTPASIPASISASIPDSTLADSASTSESAPTSPVPTLSSADEDGAGKGAGGTGTDAGAGTGVGTGRQGVGAWAASTGGVGMVGGTGMGSQGVGAVGGLVGSTSCGRSFILYAQAFSAQLGALTRKVELYSLVATFVTLLQVCLCVLQLRVSASQSVAGRTSIVGIFAQSLLDALLCMGHLTLSFALPSVFFASFIWICLLQLLLFSVFQMRLVVNAYQSRHAQELQQEGWQGLRQRLVHLHIRFYAVVMASLLLSVSLYTRPVLAVLLLFSHWLPQILFSAYDGTKPPFHPAYLLGTAAARLFIPLYLLGCPNNFLTELNNHFGMQALQTSAAAAALSLSLSLPATAATAATAAATAATATAAVTATANAAAAAASVAATTGTTSQAACLVLLLWTVVQVGVLLLQGRLGPRFFFPKSWLPQRYDYSRQVPPALAVWQEEEQGQGQEQGRGQGQEQGGGGEGGGGGAPSSVGVRSRSSGGWFGASSPSPPSSDTARAHTHADSDDDDLEAGVEMGLLGQRGAECVICYNRILLRANDYSITPCDHLFHQQCLRTWLDLKLECPICRSALPTMD